MLWLLGEQVFTAYTVMGYIAFGSDIRQFHSFGSSFWAMFQMLLGTSSHHIGFALHDAVTVV